MARRRWKRDYLKLEAIGYSACHVDECGGFLSGNQSGKSHRVVRFWLCGDGDAIAQAMPGSKVVLCKMPSRRASPIPTA